MSDPSSQSLAIVVAMTDPAPPAFAERLARFAEEAGPDGEVFVVDASGGLSVEWLARRFANVRLIYRPLGQLAPQLWRDGLVRSDAPLIAFTTSQMLISPGWRAALIDRLIVTNACGVGGPIEAGNGLSKTDRAVALLRYSGYFSPITETDRPEPPGDNVLYRRDRLEGVEHVWKDGFWEVEVHQALRERGEILAISSQAIATYQGGTRLRSMIRQRMRHGMRYAARRSSAASTLVKLLRFASSPLIPPLLCGRIARNLWSRRLPLTPWITSVPRLMLLASAWTVGEVVGIWSARSILREAKA